MSNRMIIATLVLAGLSAGHAAQASDAPTPQVGREHDLETVFQNPPDAAKPWVMQFWIGDFVSKEAITWELEAYKRSGVNGLQIFPYFDHVSGWGFAFSIAGASNNRVRPLSDEWYECVRHTIREAKRLGMQLSFHNEPGYSGSGGPWVSVAHSLRLLVQESVDFIGPGEFKKAIPTSGLDYRDVAVLAYRMSEAPENTSTSNGKQAAVTPIPLEQIVDLTGQLDANGALTWTAPAGRWRIVRFGHTSTRKKIHPVSPVAEGYECDKMNPEAVRHHFEKGMIGRILALEPELNGTTVVGVELDSYEGGNSDWTPAFREEFKKRRGYDLLPWLPAWHGKTVVGSAEQSDKFRHDVKRTIAELCADVYYNEAAGFCHASNVKLYTEAYGTALWDPQTNGGRADVPQAEFWVPGGFPYASTALVRLMASAAHTTGKQIVTAEAFTYGPARDPWWLAPGDLKVVGDNAYCMGLNHMVLSESALQFWQDRVKPGMTFDAWGTPFSVNQTWWEPGRAWMEYQARCHALLQEGHSVADILILSPYPVNGFNLWVGPPGVNPCHRNYDFDLCAEEILLNKARCENGLIVLGDMKYRVLQLVNCQQLRPQVINKLADLVEQGAVVIGSRPTGCPGLEGGAEGDRLVKETAAKLWGAMDGKSRQENRVGQGRVVSGTTPDQWLVGMGIAPDVEVPADVMWAHRRTEEADLYFLSNQTPKLKTVEANFRVSGKVPELWDPTTGEIRVLPEHQEKNGQTSMPLRFEPHQSWFVVFRKPLAVGRGQLAAKNFPELQPAQEITGSWQVRFDPKWGGPSETVCFDKLVDWTARPEPGIKYYSGTAAYQTTFDAVPQTQKPDSSLYLDLGSVSKLAEIAVNGQSLGIVWCPPWRVRIPAGLFKSKGNTLEIKVTNTWVNRLIGDEQEPDDAEWSGEYNKVPFHNKHTRSLLKEPEWLANNTPRPSKGRFAFATYKHLRATDTLQGSGLLGPVRVMAEQ